MSIDALLKNHAVQTIDVTALDQATAERHRYLFGQYRILVDTLKALLAHDPNLYLFLPVSQGKDSTLVELAGLQAYREAITEALIEAQRPLVIATVNTTGESLPMEMYPAYCRDKLEQYAQHIGINLYYDMVEPALQDQYMVRWAGGQKLIPNASRSADCSQILKIATNERYLRSLNNRFSHDPEMARYADATAICCVGSRTAEGNTRTRKMRNHGLTDKGLEQLLGEMEQLDTGRSNTRILKLAPIKDWATADVFDALSLAGTDPVVRPQYQPEHGGTLIESFLPHMGVLLEIYGNGSADTCEVVIGSTASAGCNGKARYGCAFCTMPIEDSSGKALTRYPRWNVLGAENALRLRDFLLRLSASPEARGFHARAFDPTAYNRIALQPNMLKSRWLDKIIAYAAQLTVDSQNAAADFRQHLENGTLDQHPGYADILNDPLLSEKTRAGMLDMYRSQAVRPMFRLFSMEHAVLLSFRWSLDGVAAAPYRPLKLWVDAVNGKRLPWPETNDEFTARHGPISLQTPLPDAVMMPALQHEDPAEFARNPISLLNLWRRPLGTSDMFDPERNCAVEEFASSTCPLQWTAEFAYQYSHCEQPTEPAEDGYYLALYHDEGTQWVCITPDNPAIAQVRLNGKSLRDGTWEILGAEINEHTTQRFGELVDVFRERLYHAQQPANQQDALALFQQVAQRTFSGQHAMKKAVPHLAEAQISVTHTQQGRKRTHSAQFTKRVTRMQRGKALRGNTRMLFYKASTQPALAQDHQHTASLQDLSFSTHAAQSLQLQTNPMRYAGQISDVENIDVSPAMLADWIQRGGLDNALECHDQWVSRRQGSSLRRDHRSVRHYPGTGACEHLLANAVVSVAQNYHGQLTAILSRTQLFDEIGAFDYQALNQQQLLDLPFTVSMAQHRQDKSQVLLEIRRIRNAQRQQTRLAIQAVTNNPKQACEASLNTIKAELFPRAQQALLSHIHDTFAAALGQPGQHPDATAGTQAKVAGLWLALHTDHLASAQDIAKRYLPKNQADYLRSDFRLHVTAQREISTAVSDIVTAARAALQTWALVVDQAKTLLNQPAQDPLDAAKPGLRQRQALSQCEQATARINDLLDQLEHDAQAAQRNIAANLTLSQRNDLLRSIAA
ncbi:adenine nucleotide alpha hydrolase family protein [Ferrimonas marina]|uniref:Uncharacterized protein n=1 Tax=Ferrimonas marina TaxID=299255 RepID=A0A1M5TXA2_9GAMM|nr:hypothetical protein [Ferrimonas marina]SHH55236.1 hypothetical protein SAMN02745129_2310 [Ferrimonas marina]